MPPIEAVLEENQTLKGRVETLSAKVVELELQLALFKKKLQEEKAGAKSKPEEKEHANSSR